jgi:hypothetical protein
MAAQMMVDEALHHVEGAPADQQTTEVAAPRRGQLTALPGTGGNHGADEDSDPGREMEEAVGEHVVFDPEHGRARFRGFFPLTGQDSNLRPSGYELEDLQLGLERPSQGRHALDSSWEAVSATLNRPPRFRELLATSSRLGSHRRIKDYLAMRSHQDRHLSKCNLCTRAATTLRG